MTNQIFKMSKTIAPLSGFAAKDLRSKRRLGKKHLWWNAGAGGAIFGGLTVLIGAIFLNAFAYLSGERHPFIWLFFPVLPLLAFGAHCLDKSDEANGRRRIERRKRISKIDGAQADYEYIN